MRAASMVMTETQMAIILRLLDQRAQVRKARMHSPARVPIIAIVTYIAPVSVESGRAEEWNGTDDGGGQLVARLDAAVSQDGSDDESTGGEASIPRDEVQELDGRVLSFP
jgi:hypothetical protein